MSRKPTTLAAVLGGALGAGLTATALSLFYVQGPFHPTVLGFCADRRGMFHGWPLHYLEWWSPAVECPNPYIRPVWGNLIIDAIFWTLIALTGATIIFLILKGAKAETP
ncbi:MAG: hypothetical protein M1136_11095 [Chloroflexi bacterium]|nr:hypothetical protein [Chloroflexota bacterium]MCL5076172.1 hypothetical protein [Chloroflexota bacterium]